LAFSNQDLNQYVKIWKKIAAELQLKTGIQQLFTEQLAFQSLSLAIARYFVDRERFDAIRSTFIYLDTNGREFTFNNRVNLEEIDGDVNRFIIPNLNNLKQFVDEFNDAVVELGIEDVQPLPTYKKK
jgi:hypothetical protein